MLIHSFNLTNALYMPQRRLKILAGLDLFQQGLCYLFSQNIIESLRLLYHLID